MKTDFKLVRAIRDSLFSTFTCADFHSSKKYKIFNGQQERSFTLSFYTRAPTVQDMTVK